MTDKNSELTVENKGDASDFERLVMPVRDVLDGKGCIWEYTLFLKGWNDLPENDKPGIVKGFFELSEMQESVVIDVYWPGVDCLTSNIFVNEVIEICTHRNTLNVCKKTPQYNLVFECSDCGKFKTKDGDWVEA